MATCPSCQNYISPKEIMTKPPFCPQCHRKLKFNREEYKEVAKPGLYIAFVFFMNMIMTIDHTERLFINVLLLALWMAFFKRYLDFFKNARLEIDEEGL